MDTPIHLLIDSSGSVLRTGLSLPPGKILKAENADRFRHAEFIVGLIDKLFQESGVNKNDLKGIIVSTGPGSFTGLRVGLATAKGLAEALKIPIIGISIFEAASYRLYKNFGKSALVVRSRRDRFYFGLIDAEEFDNCSIKLAAVSDIASLAGSARILPVDIPESEFNFDSSIITPLEFSIELEDFLRAGMKKYEKSGRDDISALEPLYIQQFPVKLAHD